MKNRVSQRASRASVAAAALAACAGTAAASLPHGVGAGDTTSTSSVLWARSTVTGDVIFEYSTTPDFSVIEGSSTVAVTDGSVPAKAEVSGLAPGTRYYYRATGPDGSTASGAFRTSRSAGSQGGLRFGAMGDWQQAPPYPVLRNAPDRDLEFVIKLGDTIYADLETPALPGIDQARTLEQFRVKHAEVLSERPEAPGFNFMRDLYASTSIYATIDDHEIVDNFAGGTAPGLSPDAPDVNPGEAPLFTDPVTYVNQTQVYRDAMRAFNEYHPIQNREWAGTGDARVEGRPMHYRSNRFGDDAASILLDSRSFRDAQLPAVTNLFDVGQVVAFIGASFDPSRTLLGRPQVDLLKQDLLSAEQDGVTWKFVTIPEPIQNFGVANAHDRFEGYAAERSEILKFIDDNEINNVVFLAGDFHGTIVNNLTYQDFPGGPQLATNAFEVVTGPAGFFNGRFGPTVANFAAAAGLISPADFAFYQALPIAPDMDSLVDDKDDYIKSLMVAQTTVFGYDPVGLNNNLPQAAGLIDATLLQGDYVAVHGFTWAEFDIDAASQDLTVTIWGIDAYSEMDFLVSPSAVTALTPEIVTQFVVRAVPAPGAAAVLTLLGAMGLRRRRS